MSCRIEPSPYLGCLQNGQVEACQTTSPMHLTLTHKHSMPAGLFLSRFVLPWMWTVPSGQLRPFLLCGRRRAPVPPSKLWSLEGAPKSCSNHWWCCVSTSSSSGTYFQFTTSSCTVTPYVGKESSRCSEKDGPSILSRRTSSRRIDQGSNRKWTSGTTTVAASHGASTNENPSTGTSKYPRLYRRGSVPGSCLCPTQVIQELRDPSDPDLRNKFPSPFG